MKTYQLQCRANNGPWENTTPRSGWSRENPGTHERGLFQTHALAHSAFRDHLATWTQIDCRIVETHDGEPVVVKALYTPYMNTEAE